MKARLVAAVLLVLAVPSASAESMKRLSERVFNLARVQYTRLDDQLGPEEFPRSVHPDGSLWKSKQNWWCSGFWPGMLWYTFAGTNDPDMAARADRNTHKLDGLIETPTHHDIGFQLNSSFGNAGMIAGITPGPILRDGALKLAGRFNPRVGAIKSWESGKRGRYPVIIDNMMNLELLMRAARYFQLDTLRSIAITHARTTLRTHFRDDFTTFHLVDFDPQTGAVTARKTVQGYSDESVWARGEAWALYGYAMMAMGGRPPARRRHPLLGLLRPGPPQHLAGRIGRCHPGIRLPGPGPATGFPGRHPGQTLPQTGQTPAQDPGIDPVPGQSRTERRFPPAALRGEPARRKRD